MTDSKGRTFGHRLLQEMERIDNARNHIIADYVREGQMDKAIKYAEKNPSPLNEFYELAKKYGIHIEDDE